MTLPPAFLIAPNWSGGIELSDQWRTDVLEGEDGTEQRVAVRESPAQTMHYSALVMSEADAGALALLLAQAPDGRFNMPRWPDATRLTANVAIGGTSIACDTTDRAFTIGGSALIWRRRTGVSEVRTVSAVSGSSITTDAATKAWTGNADVEVIPIAPAQLSLPLTSTYVGGVLKEVQIACAWEAAPLATGAAGTSVAQSLVITFDHLKDLDYMNQGSYVVLHAEVADADGLDLPEAPVTWSSADPTIQSVQPCGFYGQSCIVRKVDAYLFTFTQVTATSGSATDTVDVHDV